MSERTNDMRLRWPLPAHDYWSTPFAESLLQHLNLSPGASILDIASGHGIPAFYLRRAGWPTSSRKRPGRWRVPVGWSASSRTPAPGPTAR